MSRVTADQALGDVRRLTTQMLRALADGDLALASALRRERQRHLASLGERRPFVRAA